MVRGQRNSREVVRVEKRVSTAVSGESLVKESTEGRDARIGEEIGVSGRLSGLQRGMS